MVGGRPVLTTLDEILEPSRTAVLVVDMQNDFCSPGGVFDRIGYDLTAIRQIFAPIRRLLDGARVAGVTIVHIMMTTFPEYKSLSPAYIRFILQQLRVPQGVLFSLPDTWGWRVVDELAPQDGDLQVVKWRSSAFIGTNLDMVLRGRGIDSVIVCGEATYACVESTVRDAMHLDYYTVVAPECVAGLDSELHEACLRIMRSRILVASSGEILGLWSAREPANVAGGT